MFEVKALLAEAPNEGLLPEEAPFCLSQEIVHDILC